MTGDELKQAKLDGRREALADVIYCLKLRGYSELAREFESHLESLGPVLVTDQSKTIG
jgi:hypothetical protein